MMSNNGQQLSISCGAVVWRKVDDTYEVLLVKQFPDKPGWGIPKGHKREDESNVEAAVREVKEEAGVDIEIGEQLSPVTAIYRKDAKIVIAYLAQQVGDCLPKSDGPDSEVADVKWFKIDELPKLHRYQQSLLKQAIDKLLKQDDVERYVVGAWFMDYVRDALELPRGFI